MKDYAAPREQMKATLAAIQDTLDELRCQQVDLNPHSSTLERHHAQQQTQAERFAVAAQSTCLDRLEQSAAMHDRTAHTYDVAAQQCSDNMFQRMAYLYGAAAHRGCARDDRELIAYYRCGQENSPASGFFRYSRFPGTQTSSSLNRPAGVGL